MWQGSCFTFNRCDEMLRARESRSHRAPLPLSSPPSCAARRKGLHVMANKKIPTAIFVTFGVWIAALGSAAALTYELNRPLHLAVAASPMKIPSNQMRAFLAEPTSDMQSVLYLSPFIIVAGPFHRPAPARMPRRPEVPDGMQCEDWRELDMGSGRVQFCQ